MDPNVQKSAPASDARKQSAPRPPQFDTMQAVENLKKAEFQEQQAVAIVETIRDSQIEFATREDLYAGLEKLELVLRGEIGGLRSEMRDEIGSLRTEMRDEIGDLHTEMHNQFAAMQDQFATMQDQFATMYWRFLIGVGVIIGIFGTIATFVVTLAGGR